MALREDAHRWLASAIEAAGGISQERLAKDAEVSRETIYNMLHEKTDPEEGTLGRLAAALGIPAPRIEKRFVSGAAKARATPLSLVREARETLRRVEKLLATSAAETVADRVLKATADLGKRKREQQPTRQRSSGGG